MGGERESARACAHARERFCVCGREREREKDVSELEGFGWLQHGVVYWY